jgi:hypothetical protein
MLLSHPQLSPITTNEISNCFKVAFGTVDALCYQGGIIYFFMSMALFLLQDVG